MQMARSKKACLVFFDEIDAIGGARFDDGAGPDPSLEWIIFFGLLSLVWTQLHNSAGFCMTIVFGVHPGRW